MYISRLQVDKLRNLSGVSLDQLDRLNFFVGPNGSGKTSLLEAIAIASLGRSFRSHRIQPVIHRDESSLHVFLECVSDTGQSHKLGVQRDRNNLYQVRINGATADSLAQLSVYLPVLVLDASAFDLLDGPPRLRRHFLDWGVFHVEHGFYQSWKQYNRIIKQRSSLLRQGVDNYSVYQPWDKELCRLAVDIERYRLQFMHMYQPMLNQVLARLDSSLPVHEIVYRNGWPGSKLAFDVIANSSLEPPCSADLQSQLQEGFARDLRYQRCHLGPHKADIQLRSGKFDVRDIYSRGQKKTLVAGMKLAQAMVVDQTRQKKSILLLDDLPSELDSDHLQRFLDFVSEQSFQCFISTVDEHIYHDNRREKSRMFHVEHGRITAAANG